MTDPVGARTAPLSWPTPYVDEAPLPSLQAQQNNAKKASVALHTDTIMSLNPKAASTPEKSVTASAPVEQKSVFKSISDGFWNTLGYVADKAASVFKRMSDWFWSALGYETSAAVTEEAEAKPQQAQQGPASQASTNRPPRLDPPASSIDPKYAQSISSLNMEIIKRCEDEIAQMQNDFRNATSQQLEVQIYWKFVEFSLKHRELKEQGGLDYQRELLQYQEKNRGLQRKYYSLLDEINQTARTGKVLHWLNIGQTVGYAGLIAFSFATGGVGAVLGAAIPLLSLARGGTSLAEGILKYKNDLKTGDLFLINREIKENNSEIHDEKLPMIQAANEDIGTLFKALRKQLEQHNHTAQALARVK